MNDYSNCTAGVDLGDTVSEVCVYAHGAVVERFSFRMDEASVRASFEGKRFGRVAMEAGAQSGWVTRLLRTLGYEPLVANPRKLKAISANERKSDRNDALLLARLAAADPALLHPIQHRGQAATDALTVLRARDAAVRARSSLIRTVRSMCKAHGTRLKKGAAEHFVLREAEVPDAIRPAVNGLFRILEVHNAQIGAYDAQLAEMARTTFPETQRLMQVWGVGAVTALAFVLVIDDPARFRSGRTVAAYLGLVPRMDQSGRGDPQLGISKTGNNFLRRLLVQCAQLMLTARGPDSDLRRWGHALYERGGNNAKKRAIVATARKLAVLLFRLWRSGDVWVPLHNSLRAEGTGPTLARSDEERPNPSVHSDCEGDLGSASVRPHRASDCSADDTTNPSMHGPSGGPSTSADRSVDLGTPSTKQARTRTRTDRPRASAQVPATPSALAALACAGDPASTCAPPHRPGPTSSRGGRRRGPAKNRQGGGPA